VAIEQGPADPAAPQRMLALAGDPAGGLPVCADASVQWSTSDGTAGAGRVLTRAFPVGATEVEATITNACGGRAVARTQVLVAAPAGPPTSQPAPQPVTPQSERGVVLTLGAVKQLKRSD